LIEGGLVQENENNNFKILPDAFFLEMSLKIVCRGGYVGFIVPLATFCTERMFPIHQILRGECSIMSISNFDIRPGKIFQGREESRSSIIIYKKKKMMNDETKIYSTKNNRWYTSERSRLFDSLEFVECSSVITPGIIPKVGKKLEIEILHKLRKESTLSKYLLNKDGDILVWCFRPARYWIKATNFIPVFKGKRSSSSDLKELNVNSHAIRDQIVAILNSSLFYWYYIISSDCRHLNVREINNFNIDLDKLDLLNTNLLIKYCQDLMKDLEKHSKTKKTKYSTGSVDYQEFHAKYSKPIIEKIDEVLARHYRLTEEEKDFIQNFDIRYRMQLGNLDHRTTINSTASFVSLQK